LSYETISCPKFNYLGT